MGPIILAFYRHPLPYGTFQPVETVIYNPNFRDGAPSVRIRKLSTVRIRLAGRDRHLLLWTLVWRNDLLMNNLEPLEANRRRFIAGSHGHALQLSSHCIDLGLGKKKCMASGSTVINAKTSGKLFGIPCAFVYKSQCIALRLIYCFIYTYPGRLLWQGRTQLLGVCRLQLQPSWPLQLHPTITSSI